MNKDAYYFSHDSNAFSDPKIIKLRAKFGLEGYGFYWAIIEMMRNESDYKINLKELDVLSFHLQCEETKINQMVSYCKTIRLFIQDEDDNIFSSSLLRRMNKADEVRKKRVENGKLGGRPKTKSKANEKQNESIKRKEKKEKEIKEKKNKELILSNDNTNKYTSLWEADADPQYIDFCERYYLMLQDNEKVSKSVNWKTKKWYDAVRMMVTKDEITMSELNHTLNFLNKHLLDEYCPQVWSLPTLREKWIKLKSFMEKNGGKYIVAPKFDASTPEGRKERDAYVIACLKANGQI